MSTYDQLVAAAEEAKEKFEEYARECEVIAREILTEVRMQLGWPEPNNRHRARGSFDDEGRYRFWFAVRLGPVGFAYEWQLFRDGGAWFIAVDEQRFAINRDDKTTLTALVQLIETDLRNGIADTFHKNRWGSNT